MKRLITILVLFLSLFIYNKLYAENEKGIKESKIQLQDKFDLKFLFIIDFSGVYRDRTNEEFNHLEIPGFTEGHGHEDDHEGLNSRRGFNFNYSEIKIGAKVDDYFRLFTSLHLGAQSFHIEEGFIDTSCLPFGLTIRAGKFLSHITKHNKIHTAKWSFVDQPLVHNVFFGEHGLNEIGAQVSWLGHYGSHIQIGGEVLRGDNEYNYGSEGIEGYNDSVVIEENSRGLNLYTAFFKNDIILKKFEIQWGLSYTYGGTRANHEIDEAEGENRHAIEGKTGIAGGDLTFKYNLGDHEYIALQGEYIYRKLEGDVHELDTSHALTTSTISKEQSGYYAQLLIKPSHHWGIGARYDAIHKNTIKIDDIDSDLEDNLYRISGIIEFNPSEYSRLRLQYKYDRSRYKEDRLKINHEAILQFTAFIGEHEHLSCFECRAARRG